MNLNAISVEIDGLFGFPSKWTFERGKSCWHQAGNINIDEDQIQKIVGNVGLQSADLELVTFFIMGHEKGHHLQYMISPNRNYKVYHHIMEIEADLIGGWTLAQRNRSLSTKSLLQIVKRFDDAFDIAKALSSELGDDDGNAPHHPWAEQRDLALARGPMLAIMYRDISTLELRQDFASNVSKIASKLRWGF